VLRAEGLRPLHHSHVGGVFETEAEIVRLLDDLGPDVIGFGPIPGICAGRASSRRRSSGGTLIASEASTSRTASRISWLPKAGPA
jgi:hypothetical protein